MRSYSIPILIYDWYYLIDSLLKKIFVLLRKVVYSLEFKKKLEKIKFASVLQKYIG